MSPTTTPAQLPPTLPSLATAYRALVVGATGAIGAAMVAQLQADPRCALAVGLGRHTSPVIDLDDEATIAAASGPTTTRCGSSTRGSSLKIQRRIHTLEQGLLNSCYFRSHASGCRGWYRISCWSRIRSIYRCTTIRRRQL